MIDLILSVVILAVTLVQAKPDKSIKIYLPSQILICYESGIEVYKTRISSGKHWGYVDKTKYRKSYQVLGKDTAGGSATSTIKSKNGKKTTVSTPWKIILCEDYHHQIRIHDFNSVPKIPASHGCIRTPNGKAKWIYHWVDTETKVYFLLEKYKKEPKNQKELDKPKIQIPDTIIHNNAPSIDRAFFI